MILLYRQERRQYDLTIQKHPKKSPSEIYGAEHLLRAFGEGILFIIACVCILRMPTEYRHLKVAPEARQRARNVF